MIERIRTVTAVLLTGLCLLPPATGQRLELQQVLMKAAAGYRAARTFRCETEWTRRVGDRQFIAQVVTSAERPNLFRLSASGAYFDTEVVSDGRDVLALRTARKLYMQRQAPKQLLGADLLRGIELPTPATRLIVLLLQGRWQDRSDPLIQRIHSGRLSGPEPFGNTTAFVVTFDYSADYTGRLYISEDDWIVRRIALYRGGAAEIVETVLRTDFNARLEPDTFRLSLPPEAIRADVLPRPEEPSVPVPLTTETVDGRRIALGDLRGSVVLLTFFFTTCPYCAEEVQQLQPLYERFHALGLEIIAVNGTGESVEDIKRWRDQYRLTFPVARNRTASDLVKLFNVKAYPTNVLYNREGRVVYRGEGYDPEALLKALSEHGIR